MKPGRKKWTKSDTIQLILVVALTASLIFAAVMQYRYDHC